MPVLYICPEFSKIGHPSVLCESDCQAVINTYINWVKKEMMRRTNSEQCVDDFFSLNQHVATLCQIPIQERMTQMRDGMCIDYSKFQSEASKLQQALGLDFLPLCEVISDANFAYAETGDLLLRTMCRVSMSKQERKKICMGMDCALGISTFAEIKLRYMMANNARLLWLSDMYKILNEAPRYDMSRSQSVALETISAKQIQALNRLLLIDMADWLETQTNIHLSVASGFEILPHLLLHPEMRDVLKERLEEIEMAICVISQTNGSTFNDGTTVTEVYTNFGSFAMTLGAYNWARKAFALASRYASPEHLYLIQKNLKLINLIHPNEIS